MTIDVDLGRKAIKQTNKRKILKLHELSELAHEMVACFYNFCVMEKYEKKLTAYGYHSQYDCLLTAASMTSKVMCFRTLV